MNDIVIRKAILDDLETIQQLNYELFVLESNNFDDTLIVDWSLSDDGRQYFISSINNDITLVAVVNNKIVGYIIGSLDTEGSYNNIKQAELNNMYVLEEYRSIGVGGRLFDELKKLFIENGMQEVKVVADCKNVKAVNFYKKNGFSESEITLKQKL